LPKDITVENQGRKIHWTFQYTFGPSTFQPSIPAGYAPAREFVLEPEPPVFDSAETEAIVRSMRRAYRKWRAGEFTISRDGQKSTVTFTSTGIRETSAAFDWSLSKGVLTILDHKNKKSFQGPAKTSATIYLLSGLGIDYTLFSRNYLLRLAAFRELLGPDMSVRKEGELDFGTGPCDVIKAQNAGLRLSIFIRKADSFIDSLTVENLNEKGRAVSRAESKVTNRIRAVQDTEFKITLPKDYKFKPVPKM
jgi:hypothetical protein